MAYDNEIQEGSGVSPRTAGIVLKIFFGLLTGLFIFALLPPITGIITTHYETGTVTKKEYATHHVKSASNEASLIVAKPDPILLLQIQTSDGTYYMQVFCRLGNSLELLDFSIKENVTKVRFQTKAGGSEIYHNKTGWINSSDLEIL